MKRVAELLSDWNINEGSSVPAKQAKVLNLKHKGFGRWMDSKGVVTHVTRNGQLVPVTGLPDETKNEAKTDGEEWWDVFKSVRKAKADDGRKLAIIDAKDGKQLKLAYAITLWTNGHIPAVRNISKWNDLYSLDDEPVNLVCRDLSDGVGIGSPIRAPNSKEDYKEANKIMTALASRKVKKGRDLFRGMRMNMAEFEAMLVGEELDLGPIASFTSKENIAKDFADDQEGYQEKVILNVKAPSLKRGSPINAMSHYNSEEEFVTSGRFKITSINQQGVYHWVEVEQL